MPRMMSWLRMRKAAERALTCFDWQDERVLRVIRKNSDMCADELAALAQEAKRHDDARRTELERSWDTKTDELMQRYACDRKWFDERLKKVAAGIASRDAIERIRIKGNLEN